MFVLVEESGQQPKKTGFVLIYIFPLLSLSLSLSLQLLAPVTEAVTHLLHSHWRRVDLRGVRLHQITSRLMTFLLSRKGDGLWSTITSTKSVE